MQPTIRTEIGFKRLARRHRLATRSAIYPEAACTEAGDDWGFGTLIGTGAFKMDSYTNGVGVNLSAFADYHGGAPKIDGVEYKFIEDVNTQMLEYQKGNVDFVELDTAIYPVYASNP